MRKLLMVLLLVSPHFIYAKYSTEMTIVNMRPYDVDYAVIKISGNIEDGGCTYSNQVMLKNYKTDNKALYATLLAAFIANRPVQFAYIPGTCDDWGAATVVDIYAAILN